MGESDRNLDNETLYSEPLAKGVIKWDGSP